MQGLGAWGSMRVEGFGRAGFASTVGRYGVHTA